MSELDTETTGLIRREYAAELTPGDGRTVDCRIVPYGERIEHNDGLGGLPKGMPYTEEWAPGSFSHQERAANRVLANGEHQEGIAGVVGHGLALREAPDGFYGSFKIHDTAAGDTALQLIKDGVWNSVSLEAQPVKTVRTVGGVVRRVKANLFAIAFTRFGAYPGAQVLAVREQAEIVQEELPETVKPFGMDPSVVERCQALGLQLPERYTAQPVDEDTTDTAATSSE